MSISQQRSIVKASLCAQVIFDHFWEPNMTLEPFARQTHHEHCASSSVNDCWHPYFGMHYIADWSTTMPKHQNVMKKRGPMCHSISWPCGQAICAEDLYLWRNNVLWNQKPRSDASGALLKEMGMLLLGCFGVSRGTTEVASDPNLMCRYIHYGSGDLCI